MTGQNVIPPVYLDGTQGFNPDYLTYLSTLTSVTGTGVYRMSYNDEGGLVRMEFWTGDNGYINIPVTP